MTPGRRRSRLRATAGADRCERLAATSYAKVNLGLRILGRRADGFHDLETVFQTVSLADDLVVVASPSESGAHRVTLELLAGEAPEAPEENLAGRAATRFLREVAEPLEIRIGLRKRIPTGAGLGGGSSNAATTLRAAASLCRRLGVQPPEPEALRRMAAELGADVPFFLEGGRARGTGRGDVLEPLPELEETWLWLCVPRTRLATAEMFAAWSAETIEPGEGTPGRGGRRDGGPETTRNPSLGNDFDQLARRRAPEIGEVYSILEDSGCVRTGLSGSGSAVIGVGGPSDLPSPARVRLRALGDLWRVRTVTRSEIARDFGRSR